MQPYDDIQKLRHINFITWIIIDIIDIIDRYRLIMYF